MKTLILHHHIFKNAGSTLDSILHSSLGSKSAIMFDKVVNPGDKHYLSASDVKEQLDKHPKALSFSSHQMHCQDYDLPGYNQIDLAMIRHPLLRIRSIHSFYVKSPSLKTPLALAAQEGDLANFVTRLIADDFKPTGNNPQVTIFGTGHVGKYGKPTRSTLELAKKRMLKLKCVGVVENFDDSIVYLKQVIAREIADVSLDIKYKVVNQTSSVDDSVEEKLSALEEELGFALYQQLFTKNTLDIELWSFAQGLLEGRLQG